MGCFSEKPDINNRQKVETRQQHRTATTPAQDQMIRTSQSLTGTSHAANLSKKMSQAQTHVTFSQSIRKQGYSEANLHPYQSSAQKHVMTWGSKSINNRDHSLHQEQQKDQEPQSPRPSWQTHQFVEIWSDDGKTLRVPSQQQLIRRKKENQRRIQSEKKLKKEKR